MFYYIPICFIRHYFSFFLFQINRTVVDSPPCLTVGTKHSSEYFVALYHDLTTTSLR